MAKLIETVETDKCSLSVYECDCGFHLGIDTSYLEQVDEVKTLCPSCGAEIATKDSDEEELIESVPRNFKEAVSKVARERGLSEQYIINNDIVMESWCEEDKEEFTTWYDSEGNELPAGTPIGYIVYDENNEAGFLQPYFGLEEE